MPFAMGVEEIVAGEVSRDASDCIVCVRRAIVKVVVFDVFVPRWTLPAACISRWDPCCIFVTYRSETTTRENVRDGL